MTVQAAGWWGQHGAHAALVLGPVLGFALVAAGADAYAWWRRGAGRRTSRVPAAMVYAAGLSALAGLVHGVVCPEHFREALVYGVFFAVSAVGQLGWSLLVVIRPAKWLTSVGLIGNAACVLLWAVSRSVGIPLGPEAGAVESVGMLDVLATAAEIGVIALCAMSIGHHVHPWRTPRRNGCATPSSSA